MITEELRAEMERNGVRVRSIRVQDGNGNTWITIDIMEWIGIPGRPPGDPSEPTAGPPIVEGG